jgi:hypothetical protein
MTPLRRLGWELKWKGNFKLRSQWDFQKYGELSSMVEPDLRGNFARAPL